MNEAEKIINEDTEFLIIAIGWESVAKIDNAIYNLERIKVEVYDTKRAIERFNQLKSEKKKVSMLLHSTC